MGTTYNGKAGNESRAAAVNITSTATSAGLIAVYAVAHGLLTGDRVLLTGHGVVATAVGKEANGVWTVTKVDADHVTLDGSTYVGNGGATGTILYLGLMPRATLPDDGVDLRTAAAINVPNEDAKDAQAYLAERVSQYRVHSIDTLNIKQATPFTTWGATFVSPSGSYGYDSTIDGTLLGSAYWKCLPTDRLDVEIAGSAIISGNPGAMAIGAYVAEYGAVAVPGSAVQLGAGAQIFSTAANKQAVRVSARDIPTMTRASKVYLYIITYGFGGTCSVDWYGDLAIKVTQWRSNA